MIELKRSLLPNPSKKICDGCYKIASYCFVASTALFVVTLSILTMILHETIPSLPPYTTFEVGNLDVVLASTFNTSTVSKVLFNLSDHIDAIFYHSVCSDIETKNQVLNYTRTLDITRH